MPKKRDDKLISELFAEYRQMMYKIAFGILHNKSDAEDVVQDAFMCIINKFNKISQIPCREMKFYFVTITEHLSINALRKKNRHPMEDIDEHYEIADKNSVEKNADAAFLLNEVKDALTELSDRDYSLIYLYVFKRMTPKEIAQELNIPEKNIHTYIARARKRLIKILNERGIYYDI